MEHLKIKVCGMREAENISQLMHLMPDYVGFIFYPKSPRYVGIRFPRETAFLASDAKKVGVFVDADFDDVRDFTIRCQLDVLQLHGNEQPGECWLHRNLGLTVIKAFSVDESFDFKSLEPYKDAVDYYLFDTKTPQHGGSGQKFNWDILQQYDNSKPIFLSGGIGPNDAEEIKKLKGLNIHAIDINSKFETAPAMKDIGLLRTFFEEMRGG
jgi:phosphoribosylanthranilate isomerase